MNPAALISFIVFALTFTCQAHLPSSSVLTVCVTGTEVQCTWKVSLRVLDDAFLFDTDADGKLSASEWESAKEAIRLEFTSGLTVTMNRKPVRSGDREVAIDGSEATSMVTVKCGFHLESSESAVELTSRLLAAADPLHRTVVRLVRAGRTRDAVLYSGSRSIRLP